MERLALIVDDVADNRDLYGTALRLAGFDVKLAHDAETGLAIAFEQQPHVIVMDHFLPGMTGCEATRLLKSDPRTAHVPVVVVTGHAIQSVEQLARECGVDAFRTKPLKPTELLAVITALLDGAR